MATTVSVPEPVGSSRKDVLADMVRIQGGTFRMGSNNHYPQVAPVHRVTVDSPEVEGVIVALTGSATHLRGVGY